MSTGGVESGGRGLRAFLTFFAFVIAAGLVLAVAGHLLERKPAAAGSPGHNSPHALGQVAVIDASGRRPALRINVTKVHRTRSTDPLTQPWPGRELLAVRLRIANPDRRAWMPETDHPVSVRTEGESGYQMNPGYRSVTAGPVLPRRPIVRGGQTWRGVVVVEVPRGYRPTHVAVAAGPGLTTTVSWPLAED